MLAGCYSFQARQEGRIKPVESGRYEVVLPFYVDSPAESASAEAARMDLTAEFMRKNGYCPQGWSVAARQVTTRIDNFLGTAGDIYYTVECRSA